MRVTYKNFRQIDIGKRYYWTESFTAISKWQVGGLTYFRLNQFDYKAIPTEDIVSIA